jgi:hypothetical protein
MGGYKTMLVKTLIIGTRGVEAYNHLTNFYKIGLLLEVIL